ncbi:hypothetical protein HDU92_004795 [Lobulomyces angularis]|nr:hypothetical protein HDU92_004795 [Lobulomyces angularis]
MIFWNIGCYVTQIMMNLYLKRSISAIPPQLEILGQYTTRFPVDLFRLQNGKGVKLKEAIKNFGSAYDAVNTKDGLVQPPHSSGKYIGQNGCKLRMNNLDFQHSVRTFRGKRIMVFRIKKGVIIPEPFILVHEHTSHFSLQTKAPMSIHGKLYFEICHSTYFILLLQEFNENLTSFFNGPDCEQLTQLDFITKFPFEPFLEDEFGSHYTIQEQKIILR